MQVFLNPQVQTPSDAITAVGSAGSAQLDAKTALRPSFDALLDVVSTASASSATALNQHEQHAASGAAGAEFGIFDDSGRADRAQQLRDERAKHDMDSASDMRDATQAQMQSEPVRRASFDRSSTEPALQRSVAKQAAESWMDKPATEMLTQRAEESTTLQATLSSGSRHVSDSTASQSQHIAVAPGQIQTSSQPVSIANMQSHVAASASAVKPVEANSGGAGAQHSNGSTGSSGHHSLSTSSQLTNKAMFQLKSAGASKSAASPEQADRMTAQVKGALGQMLKGRGGNVMIQLIAGINACVQHIPNGVAFKKIVCCNKRQVISKRH